MGSQNADRAASGGSDTNYPKKYWWLILVAVPLTVALIQYQPWKSSHASGSPGSISTGDISIVVNEAEKAGVTLDVKVIETLKEAVALSKAGQHNVAVDKIEQVRASSNQVRALPSLLNSLGGEYLLAGKQDQARKTFQTVLQGDPTNTAARAGLASLPDSRLEGLKLVNFTSERENIWGDAQAANIVDGNPNSGWVSRDGQFPQTFIFELPVESAISEMSFNNPKLGAANRAAKDIEISVSSQSAASGFHVVTKALLIQGEIGQGIRLDSATRARWIKVRILSNYGNPDQTSLGDVSVSGRTHVG